MTTEHVFGARLRAILREAGQVLVSALLVGFAVGAGALFDTVPVGATLGISLGYGGATAIGVFCGEFDAEQFREEAVVFGLLLAMYVAAVVAELTSATALEPVTTIALGVTVALAGVAVHVLSFEDEEQVPYLSHYVETGAWSA